MKKKFQACKLGHAHAGEPVAFNIGNFNFERNFYKKLTSIQSIILLDIREEFENLDYDHFLKLKYLKLFFITTQKLPTYFISKLFKLKFIFFLGLNFIHGIYT